MESTGRIRTGDIESSITLAPSARRAGRVDGEGSPRALSAELRHPPLLPSEVPPARVERATPWFVARCSDPLSYGGMSRCPPPTRRERERRPNDGSRVILRSRATLRRPTTRHFVVTCTSSAAFLPGPSLVKKRLLYCMLLVSGEASENENAPPGTRRRWGNHIAPGSGTVRRTLWSTPPRIRSCTDLP